MYTGKNPSAIRSQNWIAQSLLLLMEKKSFQSISIKEITDRSDLSRQTFYKVFNSKEEVLEYYLDQVFNAFLQQITSQQLYSIRELAHVYFSFYKQNADFINKLFENHLSPLLKKRFEAYLPLVRQTVHDTERTPLDLYTETFISSGLVGILERYSTHGQIEAEELADMLDRLLNCHFLSNP